MPESNAWYDPEELKSRFMNALVQDFLTPVSARVAKSTKEQIDRVLLLGTSRRKEILKKKSGTRAKSDWEFTPKVASTKLGSICALIAGLNCDYSGYRGIQSAFKAYRIGLDYLAQLEGDESAPPLPDDFYLLAICMAIHDATKLTNFDFVRWKLESKTDFLECLEKACELLLIPQPTSFKQTEAYFDLLAASMSHWIPLVNAIDQAIKIEGWLAREQVDAGVEDA